MFQTPAAICASGPGTFRPMRPICDSVHETVAMSMASACTWPPPTAPRPRAMPIWRGKSCAKSSSRRKVSWTGTPGIWRAISAASVTSSNSSRWPKLPPANWLCRCTCSSGHPQMAATFCCATRGNWLAAHTSTRPCETLTMADSGSSGACAR